MTQEHKENLIDVYYNWFNDECSCPYDEIRWLIESALLGKEKDNIIEALETTYKHYKQKFNTMTHLEDLNRIEIKHLRDLLRNVKQENENLKDMNRTLQATVELYMQQQEQEYKESKV